MMNTTIDKCYVGSTCEIRSFGNELLSIGVIEEIADDYIAIVPHNERLRLFNTSAKLKLNIFNSKAAVAQSCLTLCNTMDCSTPGFPVHL